MTRPAIGSMSPFFIVRDVSATVAFYEGKLGFETTFKQPDGKPFFAILQRDSAMLLVKSGEAAPQPNATRDTEMRWDAYCFTPDPDALTAEFAGRNAPFSRPWKDTTDVLRGLSNAPAEWRAETYSRTGIFER